MVTSEYCRTMARYNEWMNARLYALCATLPEPELQRDRGAFFGSIYATLNHIAYDLFGSFAALRRERAALDARLIAWAATLTSHWLAEPLTYTSKVDGVTRTRSNGMLVAHVFNHQTHHRGQVTTLLSQRGLDMGSTDLPFMPET